MWPVRSKFIKLGLILVLVGSGGFAGLSTAHAAAKKSKLLTSYYRDALAFRDKNRNGNFDAGLETSATTNSDGTFTDPGGKGKLYLKDGFDIDSGRRNDLVLAAPNGTKGIGVITSLWQSLLDRRQSARITRGLLQISSVGNFAVADFSQAAPPTQELLIRDAQENTLLQFMKGLTLGAAKNNLSQLDASARTVVAQVAAPNEDPTVGALADALILNKPTGDYLQDATALDALLKSAFTTLGVTTISDADRALLAGNAASINQQIREQPQNLRQQRQVTADERDKLAKPVVPPVEPGPPPGQGGVSGEWVCDYLRGTSGLRLQVSFTQTGSQLTGQAEVLHNIINFDLARPFANYAPVPAGFGSTSDVTVTYQSLKPDNSVAYSDVLLWNKGYATLNTASFPHTNGLTQKITLTAAPGATVSLVSFNAAAYAGPSQGTLNATVLQVVDGSGTILTDYGNASAPFKVSKSVPDSFTPNRTANSLSILLGTDWNTGLNNIAFISQGTPVGAETAISGSVNNGVVSFTSKNLGDIGGENINSSGTATTDAIDGAWTGFGDSSGNFTCARSTTPPSTTDF